MLKINQDFQSNYLFNSDLSSFSNTDFIILVNTNLRFESSNLNLKLKEIYNSNSNLKIYNIGIPIQSTYPVLNIGWNYKFLTDILEGKSKISKELLLSKNSCIIGDPNFLKNFEMSSSNIKFNILNMNLFEINSYELGITQGKNFKTLINKTLSFILLNSNNFNLKLIKNKFIIFIGYQAGVNINHSNLILPSLSFLETYSININNKGVICESNKIFKMPLKINKIVLDEFNVNGTLNSYIPFNSKQLNLYYKNFNVSLFYNISLLENKIHNFYTSSNFHKTSLLMQHCTKTIFIQKNSFIDLKKNN